jgi:hypothetical protein
MAPAQMALPIDRRNGASAARPSPAPELGPLVVGPSAAVPAGVVPVWVRRVTTLAVLAVAIVAAVASYEHMRSLAELAGEGWRSWLLPVSVDGLAVAASMTMLVRRRSGVRAGVLPWVALLLASVPRWRRTWRRRNQQRSGVWRRRGHQWPCCWRTSC